MLMDRRKITTLLVAIATFTIARPAAAGPALDQPPINYMTAPTDDPVARLQKRIDSDKTKLAFDKKRGYLEALLKELNVPASSQVLVFSKTSFQLRRISPRTPRALYFGDDIYIGWVRGGDVMEFSAVDPKQGAIFYTLDQRDSEKPKFRRHTHTCLQCHDSSLTRGVPGHIIRSVYPAPDGMPVFRAGTFVTDHTSPLKERWGGWYVTGTHGAQRHMGNVVVRDQDNPNNLATDKGANVADLRDRFDTSAYLSPYSDIVALMVLEHQTHVHNQLTQASYQGRITLRDEQVMNRILERPKDFRSPSTQRRFESSAERLLKSMLMVGEVKLTEPIKGSSGFTRDFAKRGPRDQRGRSLRDFDLSTRLYKYPCSPLVYSEAFDSLPKPVRDLVYRRLWEVLSGKDTSKDFAHLSTADRRAIREILIETKNGLPDYWTAK